MWFAHKTHMYVDLDYEKVWDDPTYFKGEWEGNWRTHSFYYLPQNGENPSNFALTSKL